MSENKIDELSQLLGRISSDLIHVRSKTDAIDNKVEGLQEHTVRHSVTIEAAHKRLDKFHQRVDEVEDTVKEHEAIKNKGMGIVAVLGIAFGALGTWVGKFLQSLF